MKDNIIGEIRIMKDLKMKPNFSSMSRKYGIDRHTIKKYFENGEIPLRKPPERVSKWDMYLEEIESILDLDHISKKAVYMRLSDKYGDKLPGNYNSMRSYILRKGIKLKNDTTPHVLYEVEPGKQIQVDWKENVRIHLSDGTEIIFNVFSATLGYSREHIFVYSKTKTTADFIRCLITVFRKLGGVTDEILTDNMSAIVSVRGKDKKIYPVILQLARDLGCTLRLAAVRTPQTKGKDENSNKFINWIYAYDYSLNSEEELIGKIENYITSQSNQQINTGTGMPPESLFRKEKEYLHPLPSKVLMENYIEEHIRAKADSTMLFYYKGQRYSVPPAYIGKTVDVYPIEQELYVYHNSRLIAKHTISQNRINYKLHHYEEALEKRLKHLDSTDIEEMAEKNLKRLEKLK